MKNEDDVFVSVKSGSYANYRKKMTICVRAVD